MMSRIITSISLSIFLSFIFTYPILAQYSSSIICESVIDAPIDTVWAAWTTNAGLRAWLAPHAEIDLAVGGLMRTNYHADGTLGDANTIENRILSFEPGRMLSLQVSKAPEGFPFPNAVRRMWTVISLDAEGTGKTKIRVSGMGFGTGEESQQMRVFFERGNRMTLEQLQRHFGRGIKAPE